ncbi:CLUMA_CG000241, isoform A [Clunio marinus]|uniref:CLUMA_CG000241, isoform A n=1 Tax=Clunio marinus TaxID=568069 RepID=A0A1J1HEM5_9DIPT|nr:CLUMA_CG000241, isoform A [Clunio marinus]
MSEEKNKKSIDMEAPEFKDFAREMVEYIANYLENIRDSFTFPINLVEIFPINWLTLMTFYFQPLITICTETTKTTV